LLTYFFFIAVSYDDTFCVVGVEWIRRPQAIIHKVSNANKCGLW